MSAASAGEEVVTKESLVSFCWRLIPYWLNSWEQQWGAECSSVMFELPHFALELLVVLPCVQVLADTIFLVQHIDTAIAVSAYDILVQCRVSQFSGSLICPSLCAVQSFSVFWFFHLPLIMCHKLLWSFPSPLSSWNVWLMRCLCCIPQTPQLSTHRKMHPDVH